MEEVRAIDADVKQVLVEHPTNEHYRWHHCCLVVPSGNDDGAWVGVNCEYEAIPINLGETRCVPLQRNQLLDDRHVEQGIYYFDPLEAGDLERIQRIGRQLALVMGYADAAPAPTGHRWRVADLASSLFGECVPDEALADAENVVLRDTSGMVKVDEAWLFVERVEEKKLTEWRTQKIGAGNRDHRTITRTVINDIPYIAEDRAIEKWSSATRKNWPFEGPPAAAEWFLSLRTAGQSLSTHHLDFLHKMGLPATSGVGREHAALTEALTLMVCHDQLDMAQCASAESTVRRLAALEEATERNPKAPNWEGLEHGGALRISDKGVIKTAKYTQWLAERQRTEYKTLENARKLREEKAVLAKGKKKDDAG